MTDFVDVTEISGDEVGQEQVERLCHGYYRAGEFRRGRDVLEAGRGAGQGLGYIAGPARSLVEPNTIPADRPDTMHKVICCAATADPVGRARMA